jgi:large subunit ribosomal protein L18
MKQGTVKQKKRARRHARIRSHLRGTKKVPRLSVYKSNRYMYVQLIDDESGKTLAQASDLGMKTGTKQKHAEKLGAMIAHEAKALNITNAVFDRGGFMYTGRIQAVAESARKGGLVI